MNAHAQILQPNIADINAQSTNQNLDDLNDAELPLATANHHHLVIL